MEKRQRNRTCAAAGLFAVTALAAGRVSAEPTATPSKGDGVTLTEVIVTAEKRSQNLQSVPQAITAISGVQRDMQGISTIQDLVDVTPGMSFAGAKLNIRGVGQQSVFLGDDPGVAVYIDGVYNSSPAGIADPQFLIDRTEVLRGPQGTLYGRNSIGGAINTISKHPTDHFEAGVSEELANYQTSNTVFTVSGPLNDRLKARLSGFYNYQGDGYDRNTAGIYGRGGETSDWRLELQTEYDVTPSARLWVKLGYELDRDHPDPTSIVGPYDTTSTTYISVPNPTFGYASPNPSNANPRLVERDTPETLKLPQSYAAVHFDFDIGSTTLRYIGGYSQFDLSTTADLDTTARVGYLTPVTQTFASSHLVDDLGQESEYWSNELDWSSSDKDPLRWILGLYQYHERSVQTFNARSPLQPELSTAYDATTFAPVQNPDRSFFNYRAALNSQSYAVFGQLDYDLNEAWSVTLGGRYTWDHKVGYEHEQVIYFDPDNLGPLAYQVVNGDRRLSDSWGGATGRIGLQWKPTRAAMLYANFSTGYKSGGFTLGTLAPQPLVRPETLRAYAVGAKWTVTPQLRLNTEAFYYDYTQMQVSAYVQVFPGLFQQEFVNAPKAHSAGVEFEAEWSPTDALSLQASYSYLHARYGDFPNIADPADPTATLINLKGHALPQSPENKLALTGSYRLDFSPGSLTLIASYAWTDRQSYGLVDNPVWIGRSNGRADLRAVWASADRKYNLTLYVKNLTDALSVSNIQASFKPSGAIQQELDLNPPRTFGAKLEYFF